jgi:hypothetical protein
MLTVVHDADASNENGTAGGSLLDEIVRDGARAMLVVARLSWYRRPKVHQGRMGTVMNAGGTGIVIGPGGFALLVGAMAASRRLQTR